MSKSDNISQGNTSSYSNPVELTDIDMSPPQTDAKSIYTMRNVSSVEEYGSKIADAFHANRESGGGIPETVYCKDPVTQIQLFATYCSQELDTLTTLPEEYNEERLREIETGMLMQIATNEVVKMFLAAGNITMFTRYYPTHIGHHFLWKIAQGKITKTLIAKFPAAYNLRFQSVKPMDLGSTMAAVVESAEDTTENQVFTAQSRLEVIRLLIVQWKGNNEATLKFIYRAIQKFETDFSDDMDKTQAVSYLNGLINGYPSAGVAIIKNWYTRSKIADEPSAFKRAERFRTEIWPSLKANHIERIDVASNVLPDTRTLFNATIKDSGYADDFYSVTTSSSKQTQVLAIKNDMSHVSVNDRGMKLIYEALKKKPFLCPNCLGTHPVKQCPELKDNSFENAAAYIVPDYEGKTGKAARPTTVMKIVGRLTK